MTPEDQRKVMRDNLGSLLAIRTVAPGPTVPAPHAALGAIRRRFEIGGIVGIVRSGGTAHSSF